MKTNYIQPKFTVVKLNDSLCLTASDGTYCDPNVGVDAKRGFTELDEEDFDASNSGW